MRRANAIAMAAIAAWSFLCAPVFLGANRLLAEQSSGNDEIDAAIALYEDLEYAKAVDMLTAALAVPSLTKGEIQLGYRYLALSYLALNQEDGARAALRELVTKYPDFELPVTENPRAAELLAEERAKLQESGGGVGPAAEVTLTHTVTPEAPKPGQAVTFIVTVTGEADDVVLHHRTGSGGFSSVRAKSQGGGRFQAMVPGAFVAAPALEYWIAASAKGAAVASEGTVTEPLSLEVSKRKKGGAPIYAKWWFWTGLLLLGGGATAAVILLGDDDGGTPKDATVTITVDLMP